MSVSEPSTGQVAGAGAAGAAVGTAAAGGALAGAGAAAAAGVLVGPAAVVAALVSFLVLLRAANQRWLVANLGRYSRVPGDIARVVADEMRREDQFAQASADRLAAGLPEAMAIADPAERVSRVQALLDAERRYAQQRQEAMFARAIAAVTRAQLRRDSPLGAAWRLGIAKDHTPSCIVMAGGNYAGATRFWPWAVLDRVHPPRHYGCTSSLHGFGEAVANGWIRPGEIQGVGDAIRAAAGVVMEQEEADGLLRELEVREALQERGIDTSLIPWLGEAFNPSEPRGPGGRWIRVAAWDLIGYDGTRESIYNGEELGLPDRGVVRVVGGRTHYESVGNEGGARVRLERFGSSARYVDPDTQLEVVPAEHVSEAFDSVEHPRGFHGRWVRTGVSAAVSVALKRGEQATIKPADASALIDKLNDGKASSLHQLQIEGHPNLFRAHARELSRAEMPQISKANLPGFMDYLRRQGVGAVVEKHRPSELRATQNQINGAAVAAMARGWDPARGGMIMVSQEGDVLDGHHRWAAAALHEMSHPENRMSTLRFSVGTDRILALMRAYNELVGVTPRVFGSGSQEIPAAGGS